MPTLTAATKSAQRSEWFWPGVLVMLIVGAGALAATLGPLKDPDVFWHIRLGDELLSGVSIYDAGRDWSFAPVDYTWVSTQWIIEILFGVLNQIAGFDGLIAYRTVTTALTLITLGYAVIQAGRVWSALVSYVLAVFTLFAFAQERPQQVSFILLPLVGLWWLRASREGTTPRWWVLFLISAIWANCHGLWILLPAALALAAIGRVLDHGRHDRRVRPLLIATGASLLGGCVTPVGPLNLIAPIRFMSTTDHISEWQPTDFLYPAALGVTTVFIVFIAAWARGRTTPPRSELLFVLAMFAFTASASRSLCPAALVLAPVLAARLSSAFVRPRPRPVPDGLRSIAKPACAVVAAVGVVIAGFTVIASVPLPAGTQPVGLVRAIAADPSYRRVLNTYNSSGLVLWFARPEVSRSFVQVGIDGRADRYGAAYINEYIAMQLGKPGWNQTVDRLKPDVALLSTDEPLVALLQYEGWRVIGEEADFVLLAPPAT